MRIKTKGPPEMVVCVPKEWTEKQIQAFAQNMHPFQMGASWVTNGTRDKCEWHEGFVHVGLEGWLSG